MQEADLKPGDLVERQTASDDCPVRGVVLSVDSLHQELVLSAERSWPGHGPRICSMTHYRKAGTKFASLRQEAMAMAQEGFRMEHFWNVRPDMILLPGFASELEEWCNISLVAIKTRDLYKSEEKQDVQEETTEAKMRAKALELVKDGWDLDRFWLHRSDMLVQMPGFVHELKVWCRLGAPYRIPMELRQLLFSSKIGL